MSNSESREKNSDFFSAWSHSRQHIIALIFLFVIPFVLFTATTIGGQEFQRHDITQWRAAAESAIEYREEFNREPLWISNMFMGMPSFVVSTKSALPHINDIASLFQSIYPAFQYWVMLSGMYFLLILMNFRPLVSILGSLIYGLTTYFPVIIVAGHTSKFFALAWIPWLIAGYWVLARMDKKLWGLLLFSVATTLELRAGHPQITYYFAFLLAILWISDTWVAYKKKDLKNWSVVTLLLLIGGIVGIFGHADKLLPLQEYAEYSTRGGSVVRETTEMATSYAFSWSQGIKETLTLIIPDLFGGASPEYWGQKPGTSGPHYLGALVLPFLLLALFKEKSRTMFAFFAAGTLGILFAWGGNFLLLNQFAFDHIPLFNKFRAPETWLVLTAFSYSVVGAFGLSWFVRFVQQKTKPMKELYLPFGLSALIIAVLFIHVNSMDFTRPGEVQNIANQIAQQNQVSPNNPQVVQRAEQIINQRFVPVRKEKATGDTLRLALIFILGTGILYLLYKNKISTSLALIALILITAFDLIQVDKRYVPEAAIVDSAIDPQRIIESQKRNVDTFIQNNNAAEDGEYAYRAFPLSGNTFNNAIPSYFYPNIGGYTAAKLSVIQDVIDQNGPLFKGQYGLNLNLLSLMNVKFITYPQSLPIPGLETVFEGQTTVVLENRNVLPKAFFVDSVLTVNDPREAYAYLDPGSIAFGKTAVVETNQDIKSEPDSTSNVKVILYTGPEIDFEISRQKPGFMVISETYYPAGWNAYLNGNEIPIYKTNYFVRGVEIPAGNHTLEMRFEPESRSFGITLAWISLIFQIGLLSVAGYLHYSEIANNKSD